ncbi:MAG: hypothetical protein HDR43_02310 [Mycoplasma sp.]|nr:hypothetical protein [Mycoplasma sp.]
MSKKKIIASTILAIPMIGVSSYAISCNSTNKNDNENNNDINDNMLLENEKNKVVEIINKSNITLTIEQNEDRSLYDIAINDQLNDLISKNIDTSVSFKISNINKDETKTEISFALNLFLINNSNKFINTNLIIKYKILSVEDWINKEENKIKNIVSTKQISLTKEENANLTNNTIEWYLDTWLFGELDGWFYYKLNNFSKDEQNKIIEINISLMFIGDDKEIETPILLDVKYDIYDVDVNDFFNKVCDNVKLIPNSKYPNLNYKNITAKNYYKLGFEWKNYFMINTNELNKIIGEQNPLFKNLVISWNKNKFDFKKSREIVFSIEVKLELLNNSLKKNILYTINDFKQDNSLIGELDSKPIELLKTPDGAVSYKGELERFLISDIESCSINQWKKYLVDFTWDQWKIELMYQVRFALYQMFSENFIEVNYYVKEENSGNVSFTAEGVIKEDAPNTVYYFQTYFKNPNGIKNPNYDLIRRSNLKKGDIVKVKITYDPNKGTQWKPGYNHDMTAGDSIDQFDLRTWYWNFQKGMNPMIDNTTNPLYCDYAYTFLLGNNDNFQMEIFVNNSSTYSRKSGTFTTFSFTLRKKWAE